jgi:type II secretory pathway pseudopilin PulG
MTGMKRMARATKRGLRAAKGFTMIELVVVCLTAGLLGGAILGLYMGLVRSWADTSNRIVNQDDARTAVNEIARYVRMAESSDSNLTDHSDAVSVAEPQELVFFSDIDGDGHTDKVRYYLESGLTLRMATLAPDTSTAPPSYPTSYTNDGIVIMDGIRNGSDPIFIYFALNPAYEANPIPANDTLVEVTSPTTAAELESIVAVEIKLIVNEGPTLSKGDVKLDTMVQIRQRYNGGLNGN